MSIVFASQIIPKYLQVLYSTTLVYSDEIHMQR